MGRCFVVGVLCCLLLMGCVTVVPVVEGDCVDRAVVIRQHLRAQGCDAEIVLGIVKHTNEGHAWVKYRCHGDREWKYIKNY